MTKKIFAMFLAVLMVVSVLPTSVFAAGECPDVHTKSNCEYTEVKVTAPNCGNKGYTTYKCNACGDTFVADFTDPVGEHNWKDADPVAETCEKNGSVGGKQCTVCGTVVDATPVDNIPNGLKCEFGAWLPANIDCTTGGEQTRTCVHCGNVEKRKVEKSADGHHMGAWELKTPATAEANGLAVKKCQNTNCGYTVEQVVFFDHDHNAQTLAAVAEVAAKCEETGVKAHYECRVCGQKFVYGKASATATADTFNLVTDAELVIKTKHAQILDTLNCKTTTYVCTVEGCGKIIKVDAAAAHKYGKWEVLTAATCTTDGFQKKTCTVCNVDSKTEIIPALGHLQGEWTVAATCVQYGYTYTYCMRNCGLVKKTEDVKIGETNVSFDLTQGYNILSKPVANVGFYLNMVQGKVNKSLFFTGAMDGYYFATSEDITKAVKVYLEEVTVDGVENAFRMYFNANGVKNYIAIVQSGTYFNAVFGADHADKYWTWNEEYKILTTKVGQDDYFLGTRGDKEYTTFSACKISYAAENFLSRMYVSNKDGVSLLTITPNTAAGFDSTNHQWKNLTNLTASCMNDVVNSFLCEDCGDSKTEKIDKLADHKWDNGTVTKAATCTEKGEKEFKCQCTGCTATKKEEIAAKNHSNLTKENGVVKVFTEPGNHKSPISYKYNQCFDCKERVNKTDYKAWADAGKLWDTKDAAEVAHGTLTPADDKYNRDGSCTEVGYTAYTCKECSEIVRVKIANTGAHFAGEGVEAYKAPTCTENGFSLNFECVNCGKLVDETKAEGTVTELPALNHTWQTFTAKNREDLGLGEYKKAPCGEPVYTNWIGYCSVCYPNGITKDQLNAEIAKLSDDNDKNDKIAVQADTKLVKEKTIAVGGVLCTAEVYELYECHCGKTHMRGYLKTEVNVDHEWTVDASKAEKPATHTATGTKYLVCKYCPATKEETLPVLPHKNAAGEEFTNACNDPITDRHCVLCCAHKDEKNHDCVTNKDENGKADPCDCVIANLHNWGKVTYVGSICGDAPYISQVCSICYKTSAVDAEKFVDAEGKEHPVVGLGHKPVAADADKYGAYTYVPGYKHYTYKWENVAAAGEIPSYELHQFVDVYEAKFIKYTAPTYTADGYAEFVCAHCDETIKQVLPAVSGLGFELKAVNPNGAEEFTFGSLIEITVYANGNGADIYAFNFDFDYEGMIFVGYEPINEDFLLTVTNSQSANEYWSEITVIGRAANNADGKMQNVAIGEKTPMVKLQFRCFNIDVEETLEKGEIAYLEAIDVSLINGEAYELNALNKESAIDCAYGELKIKTRAFLDFNNDGEFHITDLYQAESMLTGESEKAYDVTLDLDKDGRISAKDLATAYDVYVGNADFEDVFFMGIENEAEVELLKEFFHLDGLYCVHCGEAVSGSETYCPNCGRNPN